MELIFGQDLSDNQQILLKLVKQKLKFWELLVNFLLTFLCGGAIAYHLNEEKEEMIHLILGIFTTLTSFYSLTVEGPKEPFAMIGDN